MRNYDYEYIRLYHEDEDGGEQEVEVTVYFHIQPAEPDVGIPQRYAEVSHVAIGCLLGDILIELAPEYEAEVNEKLAEIVYEDY